MLDTHSITHSGGGLSCPLAVGADLVYETNLLIPSYAPPVCRNIRLHRDSTHSQSSSSCIQGASAIVEWELQDQNNNDIWCFEEVAHIS